MTCTLGDTDVFVKTTEGDATAFTFTLPTPDGYLVTFDYSWKPDTIGAALNAKLSVLEDGEPSIVVSAVGIGMAGFATTTRVFDGLMYVVVVVAGGLFLIQGGITTADYIAYLLYVGMLLTSIRRIVEFTEQFQNGMTGIERFATLMDEQPDIVDAPDATVLQEVRGDVTFDHARWKNRRGTA